MMLMPAADSINDNCPALNARGAMHSLTTQRWPSAWAHQDLGLLQQQLPSNQSLHFTERPAHSAVVERQQLEAFGPATALPGLLMPSLYLPREQQRDYLDSYTSSVLKSSSHICGHTSRLSGSNIQGSLTVRHGNEYDDTGYCISSRGTRALPHLSSGSGTLWSAAHPSNAMSAVMPPNEGWGNRLRDLPGSLLSSASNPAASLDDWAAMVRCDTSLNGYASLPCSEDDQAVVSVLGDLLKSKLDVLRAMPPAQRKQLYAQLHLALVARQRGRARAEQSSLSVPAHRQLKCKSAEMKRSGSGGQTSTTSSSGKKRAALSRLHDATPATRMGASPAALQSALCHTVSLPQPVPSSPTRPLRCEGSGRPTSAPCSPNVGTPTRGTADRQPCGRAHVTASGLRAHQQVLAAQEVRALVRAIASRQRGSERKDKPPSSEGNMRCSPLKHVDDDQEDHPKSGEEAKEMPMKLFGVEVKVHKEA